MRFYDGTECLVFINSCIFDFLVYICFKLIKLLELIFQLFVISMIFLKEYKTRKDTIHYNTTQYNTTKYNTVQ